MFLDETSASVTSVSNSTALTSGTTAKAKKRPKCLPQSQIFLFVLRDRQCVMESMLNCLWFHILSRFLETEEGEVCVGFKGT